MSLRDIRQHIRTVRGLEQTCRAMKTVASLRLRRAEERLRATRPYRRRLQALVGRVVATTRDHPFLAWPAGGRTMLVVVAGDRGLAGGYSANVVRRAVKEAPPGEAVVVAVGGRALQRMRERGYEVVDQVVPVGPRPDAAAIGQAAYRIGERFRRGELERVVVVYTEFLGGMRSRLRADELLPVTVEAQYLPPYIIFEPPAPALLEGLLSRYLRSELLGVVLEASASEQAARVLAMTEATENAERMVRELTLGYHKARQAAITEELMEVIGAAEGAGAG